jgi:hypothetical protein
VLLPRIVSFIPVHVTHFTDWAIEIRSMMITAILTGDDL